jgi:hypothetical protein
LSRAIANGTDVQAKWLQKIIENYPRYNANWLLTGKGEMLNRATNDGDTNAGSGQQNYSDSPDVLRAHVEEKDQPFYNFSTKVMHFYHTAKLFDAFIY